MTIMDAIRRSIADYYSPAIKEGNKATIFEVTELVGALAICMVDVAKTSGMPEEFLVELIEAAKRIVDKKHEENPEKYSENSILN